MKLGRFSSEEVQFLIKTHKTHTVKQQAQALDRPVPAIIQKRGLLLRDGLINARDRKTAPPWSPAEDALLVEMIHDGFPTLSIAQKLSRTHLAVLQRIYIRGIIVDEVRTGGVIMTRYPHEVATLFGISAAPVRSWLSAGELGARRAVNRKHRQWLISDQHLLDFLSVRAAWPDWDPAAMTDPDWRAAAEEEREKAGGRWLTTADLAASFVVSLHTVQEWIRRGLLKMYKRKQHFYIWSTDPQLKTFEAPGETYHGPRRARAVRRAWDTRRRQQTGGV